MNFYENDFVYGKKMLKIAMAVALICCVGTLFTKSDPTMYVVCFVLTLVAFAAAIYIICRYCRCPHCHKVIFLGVLNITTCPKCKYNLITGKKVKKSKR